MTTKRDIAGFVGYQIDDAGNVWSFWVIKHRRLSDSDPRVLKQQINDRGYASVCLMKDGKRHQKRVNRLVCEAFFGQPPSTNHEAAHTNGIRLDNRASNLSWKTKTANMRDMNKHGTKPIGETHGNSKVTEKQVVAIRLLCNRGNFSKARIGRRFGLTRQQIYHIVARRQWRHI